MQYVKHLLSGNYESNHENIHPNNRFGIKSHFTIPKKPFQIPKWLLCVIFQSLLIQSKTAEKKHYKHDWDNVL